MTAFFDDLAREVADLTDRYVDDASFLDALAQIEDDLRRVASLNSGDREFPDDLREKVQGVIAVNAVSGPLAPQFYVRQRMIAAAARCSPLVGALHSVFHEVARRRVQARFGRWSDDPAANLRLRDAHDTPKEMTT